jgi:hypothetical protein
MKKVYMKMLHHTRTMGLDFEFLVAGLPEKVRYLEGKGCFKDAISLINKILTENKRLPTLLKSRLEWEMERIERIKKDYTLSQKEAFESLKTQIPDITRENFERWMKDGFIEYREIEGETKIFKNFLPNLLRDNEEAKKRIRQQNKTYEEITKLVNKHVDTVIEKGKDSESRYVEPVRNRVLMKLKIKPDAIPEGEILKAWMPLPRKDPLQPEVKLISATPENYVLAPEDSLQRTICFENKAVKGRELEFQVEYEYMVRASYQKVNPAKVRQQYSQKELHEKYTSEQLPHIAFTPYLRKLAKEIVQEEINPYLKAWLTYKWITEHVRYALVPEYSTIDCISDYAARNLRGDCGVQALLFITLCRISEVPARWQSGWYLNPIKPGPHDWTQFYIEPYGWLHVDPSFGGHRKSVEKYHKFYFGNIDHFRLIANIEISSEFTPPKKYYRSDNVDNQRGEVEWKNGNIYYDKWDYELEVLAHESSQ